jgi:DNA end-binding protein Ku
MKATGKIGVANVVMHNKQHLAALIPVGPMLALNTLRWAAEVRPFDEFKVPDESAKKSGVTARELDMAKKLIADMSDTWDPAAYKDTFHDDILALVDRKVQAGKTEEVMDFETPREARPSADILDLSDLLKRSLGRGGKGKPAARAASRDEAVDEDDEEAAAAVKPRSAAKKAARRTKGGGSGTAAKSIGKTHAKTSTAARKSTATTARKRRAA